MFYFVKTPWILQKLYPSCIWHIATKEKKIYLTFDDGPHALATPFVLDQLSKYKARATFFCIGKNVESNPHIYRQIMSEGHRVGNHTHNHLNGWKVSDREYFENITEARKFIDSNLFRPPYGRISSFQVKNLTVHARLKIVMWDVLSGDFDLNNSGEKCAANVIANAREGSLVIFHDSQKALEKIQICLPKVLDHFSKKGYSFESVD